MKASQGQSWMYQAIVPVLGKAIRYVFFIEPSVSFSSFSWLASASRVRISFIVLKRKLGKKSGKAGGSEHWLWLKIATPSVALGAVAPDLSFLCVKLLPVFRGLWHLWVTPWEPRCTPPCCSWHGCSHWKRLSLQFLILGKRADTELLGAYSKTPHDFHSEDFWPRFGQTEGQGISLLQVTLLSPSACHCHHILFISICIWALYVCCKSIKTRV